MATTVVITICILILISYAFDVTSRHTKIPTVILLLSLGVIAKQLSDFFNINPPDLNPLLEPFGTVGLILIVLEGSLELELNASKKKVLKSASLSALLQLLALTLLIGYAFSWYFNVGLIIGFLNAIPFSIISSSIAIPSVENLSKEKSEFVIYESSLSDIFGVILFNFFVTNESITITGMGNFVLEILIMLAIAFVASIGLAFLIKKIDHRVKYIPIVIMIIVIYEISKIYHLPALILILIFGLFLNNLDEFKRFKFIQKLEPQKLETEIHRLHEIIIELTFLVRTIFFLLFGFLIDVRSLLNVDELIVSSCIVAGIFLVRLAYLKFAKIPANPFLFIAPRGLITVLLFLSIPITQRISFINKTVMIQVILLSALLMMIGLFFNKKPIPQNEIA